MVGAFDAATGAEKWVAQAPMASFNAKTARINLATLGTQLTVLCSCGGGTMGLDPAVGKMLWSFDLFEANPEKMKQVSDPHYSFTKAFHLSRYVLTQAPCNRPANHRDAVNFKHHRQWIAHEVRASIRTKIARHLLATGLETLSKAKVHRSRCGPSSNLTPYHSRN